MCMSVHVCVCVCDIYESFDQIICSQTAGALVNKTASISYIMGNSLENDSIYKTQGNCLDKEEVETNQRGCDRCVVYIHCIGK